ncbi:hypothetical protein MRX96_046536 [Rhipicephalus microplus]
MSLAPTPPRRPDIRQGKPVEFYQVIARSQQWAKLSAQSTSSLPSALLSPLRTRTSYDASRQRVPVPAALFNASVPSKGTLFRLHLSRYAVRFYHALVEKLFNAVYDRRSIGSSDHLQRRLQLLLNCFEEDFGLLPDSLQHAKPPPDPPLTRGPLLEQTVALQVAYSAFKELLAIERSRVGDTRYAKLPDVSSERLFLDVLRSGQLRVQRRRLRGARGTLVARRLPRQPAAAPPGGVCARIRLQRGLSGHGPLPTGPALLLCRCPARLVECGLASPLGEATNAFRDSVALTPSSCISATPFI